MNESILITITTIILLIIIKRYKKKKPMTKFKHFWGRAVELDMEEKYEEAIEVKERGLELDTLTNLERAELILSIGCSYYSLKDYQKATSYFNQAFTLAKSEKFPYDKQYEKVIEAYVRAGRRVEAEKILDQLLERQSYDKRFKKLQFLKDYFL